jgi:O-antigen ligase
VNWALESQATVRTAVVTVLAGIVIGLASVVGPTLALVGAVGLVFAALTILDLTFGIVLVTVLTFFETIPTFGGGLTFIKLAGAIVIVSWLLLVLNRRMEVRLLIVDQPLFSYAVLLFLGWGSASILWAEDTVAATSYSTRLLLVALLLFVTYSAVRETRQLRLIIWAFAGGTFATAIYGIVAGLSFRGDRLVGGLANPNDLASVLAPAVALWAGLAITSRRSATRLLCVAGMAITVLALVMTQSRGGLFGLVVALLVAVFVGGALRGYAIVLCVVVVAVGIGFYFSLSSSIERERLTNITSEGSSGRTDEWKLALRAAGDHPITGVGLDNFRTVQRLYIADVNLLQVTTALKQPAAHNLYVQVLAELGLVGVMLALSVLGGALALGVRGVRRLARAGAREAETLGRALIIAFIATLALDIFQNGLLKKELWLTAGLLLTLGPLADRAEARQNDVLREPMRPTLAPDGTIAHPA